MRNWLLASVVMGVFAADDGLADGLITVSGGKVSGNVIDKAFGADELASIHPFTTTNDFGTLSVVRGFSRSEMAFELSDTGLKVNIHHELTGYADAWAGTGSEIRFVPSHDMHYEVSGKYTVRSPIGRPTRIDQDLFLTDVTAGTVYLLSGTNQGNQDGVVTYTAGVNAGTSHRWPEQMGGTLFAGRQYLFYSQNYVTAPPTGGIPGATADGFAELRLWLRGDLDADRAVDFNDLALMAQNYNREVGVGGYVLGDIDGDKFVTFGDLSILAQQYNRSVLPSQAPSQVPEPGAAGLACLVLALIKRTRRRGVVR